jgi:hypothetical protein
LDGVLRHENEAHSSGDKEKTIALVNEIAHLTPSEPMGECTATTESLRAANAKIAEKLLSSQELVCGRLRENINKKKRLLTSK